MLASQIRDHLFSRIHAEVLRPEGFRKNGRWTEKVIGQVHFAVERIPSRYDSPDCARLNLELYVFHEDYHRLVIGYPTFPGVDRVSIPVLRKGLRWLLEPPEITEHILLNTNTETAFAEYRDALNRVGLPLFKACSTLEGMLEVVRREQESHIKVQTLAGLLILLGRQQEARSVIQGALDTASDESLRTALRRIEDKLNVA